MAKRKAKAFTLIELIVVIVIIGILASVGAVAYNSIIANATLSTKVESAAQISKLYQAQLAFDQAALGGIGSFGDPDGRVNWSTFYPTEFPDAAVCDSPRPGADIPVGIQNEYDQICNQYRPQLAADIESVGNGIRDTTSFWLNPLVDNTWWTVPFEGIADGDYIQVTDFYDDYVCVTDWGVSQTTVGWDHFAIQGTVPGPPQCIQR